MIFIRDIEKFFNHEEDINQFDAPHFLQDISPEKKLRTKPLEIIHNFIGNFTQDKLKQWLQTMATAGLPIGTSIHVSTQEHSMYLQYINDDQYVFYDPNHEYWHTNDSAEYVAKQIFNNNKEIIVTSQVFCLKGTELSAKINYFFNPLNEMYDRRTLLKNLKLWSSSEEIWAEIMSINDIELLEDLLIQGSPETVEEQINNGKIKIDDLLDEVAQYGQIKLFTFLTTKFSKLITSNDIVYEASESASKYGFTDIIQKILSMNILTNTDIFKYLEKACKSGRLNIIQLLLEKYRFLKENEGIETQTRAKQIPILFQLALSSENLKTIEWLYKEYYNYLDPQSFIDTIKNIKDHKLIVWLLEQYSALIKIKDTQQKTLYDWAIDTKNDKAIILFRLANYIAKQDEDSEQLKLAKEILDDIKYSAFNDCKYDNDKKQLDILVKDDELYDIYKALYDSEHFRTPEFYSLKDQLQISIEQGDIHYIKHLFNTHPELFLKKNNGIIFNPIEILILFGQLWLEDITDQKLKEYLIRFISEGKNKDATKHITSFLSLLHNKNLTDHLYIFIQLWRSQPKIDIQKKCKFSNSLN